MSKKLNEEELKGIQDLNAEFGQIKVKIADGIIIQHKLITRTQEIKKLFQEKEAVLTKKYGQNATINLQTGEVTDPPPKDEEKVEEVKVEKVK